MGRMTILLLLVLLVVGGCTRHTYMVELTNGETFYVDPPLVMDTDAGVYHMWAGDTPRTIAIDRVRYIDDATQICYQNEETDKYTCFGPLYQF